MTLLLKKHFLLKVSRKRHGMQIQQIPMISVLSSSVWHQCGGPSMGKGRSPSSPSSESLKSLVTAAGSEQQRCTKTWEQSWHLLRSRLPHSRLQQSPAVPLHRLLGFPFLSVTTLECIFCIHQPLFQVGAAKQMITASSELSTTSPSASAEPVQIYSRAEETKSIPQADVSAT